jgi:hypothetical protein
MGAISWQIGTAPSVVPEAVMRGDMIEEQCKLPDEIIPSVYCVIVQITAD